MLGHFSDRSKFVTLASMAGGGSEIAVGLRSTIHH
jgi:hypothetical protein